MLTKDEEATLRDFDLRQEWGPCVGPTRLQRWRRAERFGLSPPAKVLALLERLDEIHPAHQSIWADRACLP